MNRADRKLWASARTLADLGELTAQWLEGKISQSPTYYGPPNDETARLVPVLAAVNRAGFVTESSQPGFPDGGDGWVQRAAVSGFADDGTCQRLREIADAAGIECIAVRAAPKRTAYATARVVTTRYGRPCTEFGARTSRRHLAEDFEICHPGVIRAVCDAWQVTLLNREWDCNDDFWPALEGFAAASIRDGLRTGSARAQGL
jgi:hypothetical protein